MRSWRLEGCRRVVAIVLGLLILASAAPAAAVSGRIHITEAGASSFPGRAYVLSLPKGMQLFLSFRALVGYDDRQAYTANGGLRIGF